MPPAAAALPPVRLSRLGGEFVDPALEQAFRVGTMHRAVPQQRTSLLIWAVLLLVFAVPDYAATGPDFSFWVLTSYRVVMAALLFAAREALRRSPELGVKGHLLMWLGLLGYPLFFLFYALRPDIRAINTGMIMVIQITLFLFLPVRVKLALPVAVFGALGATASMWATSSVDVATKVATGFLVLMPAVVGYATALRLQKTERLQFWLHQQLHDANRELQGEVMRRVALQDELERQASTDQLTGLPNRRALGARFAIEAARGARSGESLSLAMLDLDHFKRVNDQYGHAAGDAVLRSVGQLCHRSFREGDTAARVGGEEFAVLLPCANLEQAVLVMERFGAALAGLTVETESQSVRVTTTAGVAEQRPGESLEALMARADAALYAGKQAGRNRVVRASLGGPPTST